MANNNNTKPAPKANTKPANPPRQTGRAKPLAAPGGFRGNRKRYGEGGKS